MARTSLMPHPNAPSLSHSTTNVHFTFTPDYISLSRLICRLQASILPTTLPSPRSPDHSSQPSAVTLQAKASPYHRTRLLTNIEHARIQLVRLEQSAQLIKIQSQKRDVQNQLGEWRDIIRALKAEVEEWGRVYGDAGWYQAHDEPQNAIQLGRGGVPPEEEEEEEDLLGKYGRTKRKTSSSDATSHRSQDPTRAASARTSNAALALSPASPSSPLAEPSSPQSHHNRSYPRRRRPPPTKSSSPSPAPTPTTATSTGTSFPSPTRSPSSATTQTQTQALTSASVTHANLTESLASLSTQLRLSTQSFSNLLAQDTTLLDRASESLEKNVAGMAAAGKRMGVLRRYSEGKGWWGRMMLYAWIFGLWIAMVVVVGLGPKLRFG